jgi:aminoglycoside phosphotransferase family enzyme
MTVHTPIVATPVVGLAEKVRFLARPTAYPEAPERVETVETHMAWVFLTDRFAYKLKKPVRYDYLDFSTVEARRRDGLEEVRLNRRLAGGVYLGIVPLTREEGPGSGRLGIGGEGEVVDWLVQMRRLPSDRMLDRAIEEGAVTERDVRRAAELMAAFYRDAPPVEMTPARYRERFRRDVEEIRRELSLPELGLPRDRVEGVAGTLLAFIDARRPLFDRRVEAGRIVEAHGDLRPEHVCLTAPPVAIDCLEFNRGFRLLDPADELAFFSVECERLKAGWVGERFVEVYRSLTGDRPPPELFRFYQAFRAALRAKLAAWHTRDDHRRNGGEWLDQAADYLARARGYLQGTEFAAPPGGGRGSLPGAKGKG